MTKKMTQRRPWFLWIGGACFLVGSLVAGSVSLASSATSGPTVSGTVTANQGTPGTSSWPVSASQNGTWQQEITDGTNVLGVPNHPLRTDPTGTTTQPVSGTVGLSSGSNVGISGSLPAGTNNIGTVNVASPTRVIGSVKCQVPDGSFFCTSGITGTDLAAGSVVNTLQVFCELLHGTTVAVDLNVNSIFSFIVPLTFMQTVGIDQYVGTLTNLDIPIQSESGNFFAVSGPTTASLGNGAQCTLTWTGTTS